MKIEETGEQYLKTKETRNKTSVTEETGEQYLKTKETGDCFTPVPLIFFEKKS